ncbi:metalloregulator ArsR/SmtB family transcription factor [Streptomyces goshikiensis]|uniref:metalloregulator ArsR/SmtB family transcription factor n=1 Tax=Streptomyces sp. CB03578 TaxID=1718987 RepID=UPI00093E6384|nr:metalloregulator ArsR/SmtB family transcription factor [Streptomyces sp. CB03578]OKI28217.1 transcriptional regulator [Streptomyces sp. CB03578]
MSEQHPQDGEAGVFRALADPTRRQILEDLRSGELAAGEIAARFPISAPSVSRHLGVLKGAGLVAERREGNRILYSLVEDRIATSVGRFLSAVCPEQIVLRHTAWRHGAAPAGTPRADEERGA